MRKLFYTAIVTLLSLNFICAPITTIETEINDGISVVSDFSSSSESQNTKRN